MLVDIFFAGCNGCPAVNDQEYMTMQQAENVKADGVQDGLEQQNQVFNVGVHYAVSPVGKRLKN